MPLYPQYHVPNLWSSHVQGWVGLQEYLIFISILSYLALLKLVSYLGDKRRFIFLSYLRYFFKLSSPTLENVMDLFWIDKTRAISVGESFCKHFITFKTSLLQKSLAVHSDLRARLNMEKAGSPVTCWSTLRNFGSLSLNSWWERVV